MNKQEILKTIHDLLSVRKGNKGYNDVWNKGYELHQLIETKQLNLTDVVEPKGTCCLNLKKVGKVNDMFESWDECENCGKEIV